MGVLCGHGACMQGAGCVRSEGVCRVVCAYQVCVCVWGWWVGGGQLGMETKVCVCVCVPVYTQEGPTGLQ